MALLPKLKTKDKAKSVSFFGKGTNQNCALLPAPSFLHSASPLFTLALAQIICKNLSYFPCIVEREHELVTDVDTMGIVLYVVL